jgi:NTP pyrophosphatase (non-canonical NTP hydrolase)
MSPEEVDRIVVTDSITFEHFRIQNLRRCEDVFHPLHHWGLFDWSIAMIGEFGEAMNVLKKIRRIHDGTDKPDGLIKLQDQLAEEIADAFTYGDLLLSSQGYRLEEEIVNKFNRVSEKRGSSILL